MKMKHKLNTRLVSGLILLALFAILGFVLPWFAPVDPREWSTFPRNLPPSSVHLLGTTSLGQDTFWYLTWAIKNSLYLGILVALMSTVVGVAVGLFAGLRGGWVDRLLTTLMDSVIVVPVLPIQIMFAALLKGRMGIWQLAVLLVLFNWPWPARQARASALSLRERDFVNTAWFSGENNFKIMARELFPFISSWAMGNFINTVLVAIGAEGGLAIIGVSSQSEATLGTMINWAMRHQALLGARWYWIGSPIVAQILLFIGLFLTQTGMAQYAATKRGR